jgi:hypothetical protein
VSQSTQSQPLEAPAGANRASASRSGREAYEQAGEISTPRETILRELLDEAHTRIRLLERAVTALMATL